MQDQNSDHDGAALQNYLPRFAGAIEALSPDKAARICLAVSGGADSMAMLLLSARAMPGRIFAATVDHGLRIEAAQEAEFVAEICASLDVPHAILRPDAPIKGNIQSAARAARYRLLNEYADANRCSLIATAHHTDDQVETFLMRLARGSGIDGLSAVREKNHNIIRPMLRFRRKELEEICEIFAVNPVQDPSNHDDSFDRVKMRQWLSENTLPFSADALRTTTSALSQASEALSWMADQLAETRLSRHGGVVTLHATDLPKELQRRLLLAALQMIDPEIRPRGEALSNALDRINSGQKTMLGNALISPAENWQITFAPPRAKAD